MSKKNRAAEATHKKHCKDNKTFCNQKRAVYLSLKNTPKTMLMVARELGIERASVCWYVFHLRNANMIQVHHSGICHISGVRANFLTTNKALFRLEMKEDEKGGNYE